MAISLKNFRRRTLVEKLREPVAVACRSRDRVVLLGGGQVGTLDPGCLVGRGRCRVRWLGSLPKAFLESMAGHVTRFFELRSSWLVVPHSDGYAVFDLLTGRRRILRPVCRTSGDRKGKRRHAPPRGRVRYVHPVSFLPDGVHMAFLALQRNHLVEARRSRGSSAGRWQLVFGILDVPSGGVTACSTLPGPWGGLVRGLEVHWRADGQAVSLSVQSARGVRHLVGRLRRGSWRFHPVRGLEVIRFHGWRGSWLIASANWKGRRAVFRFRPTRRRRVRIRSLQPDQRVLRWVPSLRTLLLDGPARGRCTGRLLRVVVQEGHSRRLPRWAVSSRLLAQDPAGRWGLLLASGSCRGRPRILLARLDGRRIARVLPRRLAFLARARPDELALCP